MLTGNENADETLENAKAEMIAVYGEPNLNDYSAIIDAVKASMNKGIAEERMCFIKQCAWHDSREAVFQTKSNKKEQIPCQTIPTSPLMRTGSRSCPSQPFYPSPRRAMAAM